MNMLSSSKPVLHQGTFLLLPTPSRHADLTLPVACVKDASRLRFDDASPNPEKNRPLM